jgi:beta-lactamase class A
MKKILPALLLMGLFSSCQRTSPDEIKRAIQQELGNVEGEFAVAFQDLKTGEHILINEHTLFHAASTMKVPVMIEVFKQAAEGKFALTDSVKIKNEFKSIVDSSLYSLHREDDSDTLIYDHIGENRTVHSLMYDMIIISSNLATNLIIDLVGAPNAQQTMYKLGTKNMQVLRGVEDAKAYQAGLNNSTTAYDLLILFEKMAKGEVVDSTASAEMIRILLDQKFNDIIPAELPSSVKVAHKTGWITGIHHDGGIIFLPDGRQYVLVLLSKNLKDEQAGVAALSKISKLIYNWMK